MSLREEDNLDVPKKYGTLDPGSDFTFQASQAMFAIGYALWNQNPI